MASITPDTEVCELNLESAKNLTALNTKRLEELYDIKVEQNKKKLILVGEKDNIQKAQRYLISLLRPSECICQIYDCSPENIKFIERNLLMAERRSGCYIKKGEDSYFLVYGIDQEDIAVAISLLDAAISGKLQKLSLIDDCVIVTSDLSMSSCEESMDLIADDNDDDDPQLDFENNSSLEVSQMMSDVVLESQGSSPSGPRHQDCTIDLRSDDDDDDDCVIISDSPTPVKKKKKKKKRKKKPQMAPTFANQPSTSSNMPQTSPLLFGDQLIATTKTNLLCRNNMPLALREVRNNHPEPANAGRPGTSGHGNVGYINQFQLNVMQNNIGLLNPRQPFEQFPFPTWPQNLPVSFNRNIPQHQVPHPLRTGLRKIVIDGSNIAMLHGLGRVFSCRGIELVVNYFERRGHKEIAVFVPQWRRSRKLSENQVTNPEIMERLYTMNKLFFTPSREVDGKIISSYDDRFILKDASDEGGIVVSNDQYKDLYAQEPSFRETIERRILQATFVGDKVMFPDDPLGRNGPSLDEFLTHSYQQREALQARHRSPSTVSRMQHQPNKKARSSSCKAFKNNPRPALLMPNFNYRPSDGRNFNNPMWHRPPFGILLRSRQATDDLRRALNKLPYSNPQKVNKILNDHPSVSDLNFLRALL